MPPPRSNSQKDPQKGLLILHQKQNHIVRDGIWHLYKFLWLKINGLGTTNDEFSSSFGTQILSHGHRSRITSYCMMQNFYLYSRIASKLCFKTTHYLTHSCRKDYICHHCISPNAATAGPAFSSNITSVFPSS